MGHLSGSESDWLRKGPLHWNHVDVNSGIHRKCETWPLFNMQSALKFDQTCITMLVNSIYIVFFFLFYLMIN